MTHLKLSEHIQVVFRYLKTIPKGSIVTYALVAKQCRISNPRNIGWILQQNADGDTIPCYKVVRSDGTLAGGYKFGGAAKQKARLVADGVRFEPSGKIDLDKFLAK